MELLTTKYPRTLTRHWEYQIRYMKNSKDVSPDCWLSAFCFNADQSDLSVGSYDKVRNFTYAETLKIRRFMIERIMRHKDGGILQILSWSDASRINKSLTNE